jgi:two-component system response regulator VicR
MAIHRGKVLVIDDDRKAAQLIIDCLVQEGFEVVYASSGETALQLMLKEPPGIVLTEVILPGFDGYETCRQIRAVSSVPILFVSRKHNDIDKILGLGVGGDDYITKPFNPHELVARVKAHMRRYMVLNRAQDHEIKAVLRFPGLEIDVAAYSVSVYGRSVSCSPASPTGYTTWMTYSAYCGALTVMEIIVR